MRRMRITNELRDYIWDYATSKETWLDIADRIDVEHGKQVDEAYATGVQDGIDADRGPMGFVELPKDADGVPICVGDVVEEFNTRTVRKARGEVIRIVFGKYATDVRIDTGTGYADRNPANVRHVGKKQTVEDVLREFYSRYCTTKPKEEDDAILAEYVAKLRLAGD